MTQHSHFTGRAATTAALVVLTAAGIVANAPPQVQAITSPGLVERFLAPEQSPLVSYRAVRRLSASSRGGKMQAVVEAVTSLDPKAGFAFHITSEEGSATIRHRVLIAALETEQKTLAGPNPNGGALTRANYEFLAVSGGEEANLSRVGIRPLRKHGMLLSGALFLASDTGDLVRVEGEPSERPSFWTRHVTIVREYARMGGVRVPVAMHSTADVLVAGSSVFSMTYRYTNINGEPVE